MTHAPDTRRVDIRYRFTGDEADPADLAQLSSDERARAGRFLSGQDRASYAAAHALARRMLAAAAAVQPDALTFVAGPYGKPAIAGPEETSGIAFNIAHTRGLVACAVCLEGDVGVDVEAVRAELQPADLAQRFFATSECEGLAAVAADARPARFTDLWALKEAYIKAVGLGLSHALDTFAFSFGPDGRLSFQRPPGDTAPRVFALFEPKPGFRLAVAAPSGHAVCVVDDTQSTPLEPMYTGAAGGTSHE